MGRVCVGAQEGAGGGPSFLHEAGGTALEATFVSGPGRGRRGFSCLKSSCPRVKGLSWFPHFQVVARASVYPSVRCRNSPFLWQRWGRPGQGGGQWLSRHPGSGRGRQSERQADPPRRSGAPGPAACAIRTAGGATRLRLRLPGGSRGGRCLRRPLSRVRVCHRRRWSVLQRTPPPSVCAWDARSCTPALRGQGPD